MRAYKCDKCGKAGCKLWREYSTFANHTSLYCRECAETNQAEHAPFHGDQIGWLVPAVPSPLPVDGIMAANEFWGYSSVPDDGVRWWKNLPEGIR